MPRSVTRSIGRTFGSAYGAVVGQRLQQGVEGLVGRQLVEFGGGAVEHVLIGNAPGRIHVHRVNEILAADEAGHSLVAEEARLVVPLEVAVVHVEVVVAARTEQLRQAGELVRAFGGAHQVLESGQVREAGHRREHALVGVRAIGEEAVEEQALPGQCVEVRGDVARAAQRADEMPGEAFHQDDHDVANRQGTVGGRSEVTSDRRIVGVDQAVVRREQQLANDVQRLFVGHGRLPGIAALRGHAGLGRREQRQRTVEAQLIGEHRIGGVGVSPAQWRSLPQVAAGGDHGKQGAEEEKAAPPVPGRRRVCRLWRRFFVQRRDHRSADPV